MNHKIFVTIAVVLTLIGALLVINNAKAGTCGPLLDPINDINWQCVFPIRTGGVVEYSNGQPDPSEETQDPLCSCQIGGIPYFGISASYWEPFAIMDSVKDPYCFMPLATEMSVGSAGRGQGNLTQKQGVKSVFAQVHYYKFPAFNLLELFQDLPCNSGETEFDVAMMTEVIPTWNDQIMALIMNPEAVLFGNPATILACTAEVARLLVSGKPIDYMYWCMGSWGSAYPLAGTTTNASYIEANAAITAKGLYSMARTGLLLDRAVSQCGSVYTPIWRKSHYKMQQMRPVKDSQCRSIGASSLIWGAGKNPPFKGDNFSWMMFRKNRCCMGL